MDTEREAGRPGIPAKLPEGWAARLPTLISLASGPVPAARRLAVEELNQMAREADAARAMLAAFKPHAVVSAWPDAGWPDDGEELDDDEEWVVGIAYKRAFDDSSAYEVTPRCATPSAWMPLAEVRGEQKARALAGLLNALAERGA